MVETVHPHGHDVETVIGIWADALGAVGAGELDLPGAAHMHPTSLVLQYRLLSVLALAEPDPMEVEELGVMLFASSLSTAAPRRVDSSSPTENRRRRIIDDARMALVADPTISSVVRLGQLVGCSPHHLSRLFVEHTGRGVASYRTLLRIHSALARIGEGESDLARLAHDCGFSDHAHMTRTIRRHLGQTPSVLRSALARQGESGG